MRKKTAQKTNCGFLPDDYNVFENCIVKFLVGYNVYMDFSNELNSADVPNARTSKIDGRVCECVLFGI